MNTCIKAALTIAALTVGLAACSGGPEAPVGGDTAGVQSNSGAGKTASETQGSVQRNYPSASEEAAFKLNYPIFLAYGPNSARLTAFFPGASKQPVSVKLAPNAAGYSVTYEGTACAFPVVYELKSADGQSLATGEFNGTPAILTSWDVNKGAAVLSISMAEGAKNNFGCNLVVSKK